MRPLFSRIILFVFAGVILSPPVFADIGKVIALAPGASVLRNGNTEPLTMHAALQVSDTVQTDATGRVRILFNDDSSITVGPNTSMDMNDYVDTGAKPAFNVHVNKGVIRAITGKITSQNPNGFKMTAPGVTAGIRGTIISVRVQSDDKVVVYVENTMREVVVNDINVPGNFKIELPGEVVSPMEPEDRRQLGQDMAFYGGAGSAAASPAPDGDGGETSYETANNDNDDGGEAGYENANNDGGEAGYDGGNADGGGLSAEMETFLAGSAAPAENVPNLVAQVLADEVEKEHGQKTDPDPGPDPDPVPPLIPVIPPEPVPPPLPFVGQVAGTLNNINLTGAAERGTGFFSFDVDLNSGEVSNAVMAGYHPSVGPSSDGSGTTGRPAWYDLSGGSGTVSGSSIQIFNFTGPASHSGQVTLTGGDASMDGTFDTARLITDGNYEVYFPGGYFDLGAFQTFPEHVIPTTAATLTGVLSGTGGPAEFFTGAFEIGVDLTTGGITGATISGIGEIGSNNLTLTAGGGTGFADARGFSLTGMTGAFEGTRAGNLHADSYISGGPGGVPGGPVDISSTGKPVNGNYGFFLDNGSAIGEAISTGAFHGRRTR